MSGLCTIGVYGFSAEPSSARSRGRRPRLLDVRQRRGVRGREYAWANAARLQAALAEAEIDYRHLRSSRRPPSCASSSTREDERAGVGKRSREELAPEYRERYTREVLDRADLGPLVAALPAEGARRSSASSPTRRRAIAR